MQPVLRRISPYRKRIILGQTFKFAEVILELIVPLLIARMIDQGIANSDHTLIIRYTIFSLILAISGMLFAFVCQYNASIASQAYGTDLRNDLYAHILKLSESDVKQFGTASLTTRITSDIQVLQHALAMLIRLIPRTPFICIGSIIMVLTINTKFVVLFLLAIVIFILIIFFLIKSILPLINKSQQLTDRLTGRMLELLNGIRVIRAISRSEEKAKQYQWTNEDLEKILRRIGKLSSLLNPLTMLALNLIAVIVLWLSAGEIRLGNLYYGEIIALINYLTMLLTALIVLSNLVLLYARAYASALRVSEVFEIKNRVGQATIEKVTTEADVFINFKQINFSYPNSSKLLFNNLSFTVPINKSLGIIGPTGSGKSSLAYLIEKRYPVQAGLIELFGRNIDSYSESELLDTVQLVSQKSSLFSGTLKESLTAGLIGVTDEEIWQILHLAQAENFVAKNKRGLLQSVERGGNNFSGGQKQRLCIARALLRKPKVLILDDSSSALDLATDSALQKALTTSSVFAGLHLITISQRITAVRRSDLILLLDNGEVSGFGTDKKLLKENPLYQEIYKSQIDTTGSEYNI